MDLISSIVKPKKFQKSSLLTSYCRMKKLIFKWYKVVYPDELSSQKNFLMKYKTLPYSSVFLGHTVICPFAGISAKWDHFCGCNSRNSYVSSNGWKHSPILRAGRKSIPWTLENLTGFIHFLIVIKRLNPFKPEIILELLILFELWLPNLEWCNRLKSKCYFLKFCVSHGSYLTGQKVTWLNWPGNKIFKGFSVL